jgi:hypothetical protein
MVTSRYLPRLVNLILLRGNEDNRKVSVTLKSSFSDISPEGSDI